MKPVHAQDLVEAARAASERGYAPYSGFRVGAALLGEAGGVFTGCNVENASLGMTICAEQSAVVCAVAAGERRFQALAIYCEAQEPAPPCGACRQVLREFARDLRIYLAAARGDWREVALADLYPEPFGPDALRGLGKD